MFRNIILALAGIVIILILVAGLQPQETFDSDKDIENTENTVEVSEKSDLQDTQDTTSPASLDERKETSINLGNGMRITEVGKYTGVYMEDGSDEIVSGVMMIVVKNEGENTIQYAEITMPVGEEEAFFTMSTLTPGSTMILLEQNRMDYIDAEYTTAVAENVAIFSEPLSLCEDKLKLQILDGAINVSNISGEDISGDIMIYYKNSSVDAFYGGITYRVRIEDGLKKDEIKQIMASHFSESGSTIMFVTIGEN